MPFFLKRDSQGGRVDCSNSHLIYGKISRQVPNRERVISTPSHRPPAKSSRAPGIVARLQQVHGLTKKKLYGSANRPTSITPFFKEEPTNNSPQSTLLQPTEPPEVQKHSSQTSPSSGKVQTRSRESRKNRQTTRTTISPSRTCRSGKKSSRSPGSGNSLPLPTSPPSPTQCSIHSSYSDASTATAADAPVGLCDNRCGSQNLQTHRRELTFSHTDVREGSQPLPSQPPTLGSNNGTPDYSGPYLTSTDIMTFETSLSPRFGGQAPLVEPSIFLQSNIDYTWNSSYNNNNNTNTNPAPVNSFPWSSNSEMIMPSHDLGTPLHAEADNHQNSTPQTLSSSPGMVSYISSEPILSNHLAANTAEQQQQQYGPESYDGPKTIGPESRSPTHALPIPTATACFSDNIYFGGLMTPHDEASSLTDRKHDYYYTAMDSSPQFYHSSSSSLSAMIIPQIKTDSSRT